MANIGLSLFLVSALLDGIQAYWRQPPPQPHSYTLFYVSLHFYPWVVEGNGLVPVRDHSVYTEQRNLSNELCLTFLHVEDEIMTTN